MVADQSRAPDRAPQERALTQTIRPPKLRSQRRIAGKPTCESCYFGIRMLCALELGAPCSTFRPDSPHGLVPPSQPMLLIEADETGATASLRAAA